MNFSSWANGASLGTARSKAIAPPTQTRVGPSVSNVIVVTSYQGRLLMVKFNVIESLEPEWLGTGNKALLSIQLSE